MKKEKEKEEKEEEGGFDACGASPNVRWRSALQPFTEAVGCGVDACMASDGEERADRVEVEPLRLRLWLPFVDSGDVRHRQREGRRLWKFEGKRKEISRFDE